MSEQAGREMDARVAEKVMGFRKHLIHGYLHNAPSDEAFDASDPAALDYDDFYPGEEPHYSTSIAAAWEVVERFRRGCNGKVAACVDVCVTDIPDPCDTYCKICGPDTAEVIEWADTAPLAICKAALKAVGA